MKIVVLNGSPRRNGTVASLLKAVCEPLTAGNSVEWVDVCSLQMKFCTACMVCREKGECILPHDDAHRVGKLMAEADALIVGTPTHWGNMSAPLKLLFDRNVPRLMSESPRGIPIPLQKGKPAIIVTACTTPWPFNFILPESRGAIRAVKEVLGYGGYKVLGTVVRPGSKSGDVPASLLARAKRLGEKMRG